MRAQLPVQCVEVAVSAENQYSVCPALLVNTVVSLPFTVTCAVFTGLVTVATAVAEDPAAVEEVLAGGPDAAAVPHPASAKPRIPTMTPDPICEASFMGIPPQCLRGWSKRAIQQFKVRSCGAGPRGSATRRKT
jgi:hypothetical protein